MVAPTIFFVTDIETTLKHRIAFDVAWLAIDRKRNIYGKGSFIIKEAFLLDVPFFKEKLGFYFEDTYARQIKPLSIVDIKSEYNKQVTNLLALGHKVIFAAYNASFDAKYLGETTQKLLNEKFLDNTIPMLDIWDYWTQSAPKHYAFKTDKGNPKTSAEMVYRFESQDYGFEERHIAMYDVEIEADVLIKTLARKKKMPLVTHPKDFNGQPWRRLLKYPAFI